MIQAATSTSALLTPGDPAPASKTWTRFTRRRSELVYPATLLLRNDQSDHH
jgi:hypothetical protein